MRATLITILATAIIAMANPAFPLSLQVTSIVMMMLAMTCLINSTSADIASAAGAVATLLGTASGAAVVLLWDSAPVIGCLLAAAGSLAGLVLIGREKEKEKRGCNHDGLN